MPFPSTQYHALTGAPSADTPASHDADAWERFLFTRPAKGKQESVASPKRITYSFSDPSSHSVFVMVTQRVQNPPKNRLGIVRVCDLWNSRVAA